MRNRLLIPTTLVALVVCTGPLDAGRDARAKATAGLEKATPAAVRSVRPEPVEGSERTTGLVATTTPAHSEPVRPEPVEGSERTTRSVETDPATSGNIVFNQ